MASISKERLREMEEEMDRFEAEIQGPGGPPRPGGGFILGANTFDKVQAQLSTLRQESTRLQRQKLQQESDDDEEEEEDFGDEDLRRPQVGQKRKYQEPEHENEFHDIDERPGRPQGPLIPPPPPPPPRMLREQSEVSMAAVLAPPPPPPPEPEGHQTMSFKPYAPGEGHHVQRPAFMPPQLRHRPPQPPPGHRPPFGRPPMRMGGPPMGPPMGGRPPGPPMSGPPGPLRAPPPPPPNMMGPPGPQLGPPPPPPPPQMGMGPGPPHMGPPMGPHPGMHMPGPPMSAPPGAPGMDMGNGRFVPPSVEISAKPVIMEQPKVVYSAAPQITVERKEKKKKKKKLKAGEGNDEGDAKDQIGPSIPTPSSVMKSIEEDRSVADMDVVPESAMMGGFMAGSSVATGGMVNPAMAGMPPGAAPMSKKEKKKKDRKFIRMAASTTWEDPTLSEWQQDDFRMFCGDLGNEVTDETLVRAFNKYPGFLKAKVVRDRRTNKTKGYGFVSFKDPVNFTRAMREMNGKYVGNRPIKLRKSNWKDRNMEVVKKKEKEKKKLGLK